jgi:hypothetical protein
MGLSRIQSPQQQMLGFAPTPAGNDNLPTLVGDPAEDLGVARICCEGSLPWAKFRSIYAAAGGGPVRESRVQFGMLMHFGRASTLVAAGRKVKEGSTREFIKNPDAFTGLRLIELRIAQMPQRLGAV